MFISGDAHILDYRLRQTGELWKVVNVLADVPIRNSISQRSVTRAQLVDGGVPALPNRMHKLCGAVRQQSANSLLRAHPQG